MANNQYRPPAPEEIFEFQLRRNVTNLFKSFLSIIEREKDNHDEAMEKLKETLPAQYKPYVDLADSFTEAKKDSLRREILTIGNDCARNLQEEFDKYTQS